MTICLNCATNISPAKSPIAVQKKKEERPKNNILNELLLLLKKKKERSTPRSLLGGRSRASPETA
jgi:hypothetical protein